ncbi:hypothetical protein E3Q08_03375 [Wallemia mellicola]|uniref:Palmitoyltransferase n=1 Tax=Wallemia mellicola TaxID=1708541 RepID=A0A4T0SGP6_9BASI|nr:hypothetical protein E3Q24_01246 [Wallemia mellicola]TIB87709.1 hypothetical protein E3Q21_01206 [Wallemia mellicola]TIB90626.1 hypothetical protein E3Q20_01193 [Wallemia mellicola]TIC20408.1 hypothetical protein E3Q13_00645 [Wallemia mellicola]TIC23647.1 hypothetical protein E3Q12_01925 [Wallemia mellicola]
MLGHPFVSLSCTTVSLKVDERKGYHICIFEITPILQSPYNWIYAGTFNVLFGTLMQSYYKTVFTNKDHSAPPPEEILFNGKYRACQSDGTIRRCYRDNCNGKLKQPRSRHCGDCQVDRIDFDHHCPWFDSCVSSSTIPSFLRACIFMPLTTLCGSIPILRQLIANFKHVRLFSRSDEWIGNVFWDRWYSYPPGPIGSRFIRYVLGYWKYGSSGSNRSILDVRFDVTLVAFLAVIVSIVAIALFRTVLKGVLSAHSSIDIERQKSHKKISEKLKKDPENSSLLRSLKTLEPNEYFKVEDRVFKVDLKVYDLGWYRNYRRAFCAPDGEYRSTLNEDVIADALSKSDNKLE